MSTRRFALLPLLLVAVGARARTYNYEDIPLGERSFGMGHASMAIPGDVGSIFYNPATLAYVESSQVSASLSAYARIDTRTGEFISVFKSARDNITRGGFLAIPSMVGGNLKWGSWQWGGAILVPYAFENSGSTDLADQNTASFKAKYESVWMGIFAAHRSGRSNFGASIFYASNESTENFTFLKKSAAPYEIRFVTQNQLGVGMLAVIGGTYDFSDEFKLGYSFRTPALHGTGAGQYVDISSTSSTGGIDRKFDSTFYLAPPRLSVGFSWQVNPRLLVASDLHIYLGAKGNFDPEGSANFSVDAKAIANLMMGVEYYYWEKIAIRMGLFTNMSSAKNVPLYLTAINDKVHMFGGTTAVVFDTPTGSISLGGYIIGGQGSSPTLDETPTVTRRSNYTYGFVIGSTYKFR